MSTKSRLKDVDPAVEHCITDLEPTFRTALSLQDDTAIGQFIKFFRGVDKSDFQRGLSDVIELDHLYANIGDILKLLDEKDEELKGGLEKEPVTVISGIASIVLKMYSVVQDLGRGHQKKVIVLFHSWIDRIEEICKSSPKQYFDKSKQKDDKPDDNYGSKLTFWECFKKIGAWAWNRKLWQAISVALLGDRSGVEVFLLFCLFTLVENENEFKAFFDSQRQKHDYQDEFDFDSLITLKDHKGFGEGCGNDMYYLLALSVAIRRPIYLYGEFTTGEKQFLPQEHSKSYEADQLIYEQIYMFGHYRIVGYESDESNDPICIACKTIPPKDSKSKKTEKEYNAVLPKKNTVVKPWKLKTLLFDYMYKEEAASKVPLKQPSIYYTPASKRRERFRRSIAR